MFVSGLPVLYSALSHWKRGPPERVLNLDTLQESSASWLRPHLFSFCKSYSSNDSPPPPPEYIANIHDSSFALAATVYGWWAKKPGHLRKLSVIGRIVPITLGIISIVLLQCEFTHTSFLVYFVIANAQCMSKPWFQGTSIDALAHH